MTKLRIESHAERQVFRNSVSIYLASRAEGKMAVARPVVFDVVEPGSAMGEPTIELRTEDAQLLMDELWRAGLRPAEGAGSAGSLSATERHLTDMQRIAFQLLDRSAVPPSV